ATSHELAAADLGRPLVLGPAAEPLAALAAPTATVPAFIQFTSGTSGAPRGAVISQAAAVYSATIMGQALGLAPGQVGVSWLPLFHDMGLVGALLSSLIAGVELHVLTPHEFLLHPDRWLELVSRVKARVMVGPNFGYELASRRAASRGPFALGAVEVMLNGSEPVQRTTLDGFEEKFERHGLPKGKFRPAYGLAEATLGVAFTAPGMPDPDLPHGDRRIPSVGRPLAGMEVEIVAEDGSVVPEGVEGEITVRGPSVMDGYLGDEEATKRVLRGRTLFTGDLGVVQGGALYVTGRKKDLVIKGGEKFHPYELERVAGAAVDAAPNGAVALGRMNTKTGTEDLIVLVELPAAREAGAIAKIRGALLEKLGVRADAVLVVRPGEIPRTTSGKLRRGDAIALVEART
ncbi:AMP-binding protein, partial [Myxococcota bacterium]|nr:AMP-binding protein [Myxococcota bacterium]